MDETYKNIGDIFSDLPEPVEKKPEPVEKKPDPQEDPKIQKALKILRDNAVKKKAAYEVAHKVTGPDPEKEKKIKPEPETVIYLLKTVNKINLRWLDCILSFLKQDIDRKPGYYLIIKNDAGHILVKTDYLIEKYSFLVLTRFFGL